jgi:hypothetical protein
VNLATLKERGDTLPMRQGRWVVLLQNLVPRFNYSSSTAVFSQPPAPFKTPDVVGAPEVKLVDPCAAVEASLKKIVDDFNKLEREEEVPALTSRAAAAVTAATQGACRDKLVVSITAVKENIKATAAVQRVVEVKDNEYLSLAVRRSTPDGKGPRAWDVIYVAPTTGGWRTTFGFAALQSGSESTGAFEKSRRYFAAPVPGTTDRFIIKEGKGPRLDLVPVTTLTYQTAPDRRFNWIPNISAGLGLDLSNPFLTLGVGWTFYSNLHVGLGIAARREDVLGVSYSVGDTVRTALTLQQLMPDRDFRLRRMVSLSFRFASNPFAKGTGGSATDGKTPATESDEKLAGGTPTPNVGASGVATPTPTPPPSGSTDPNQR